MDRNLGNCLRLDIKKFGIAYSFWNRMLDQFLLRVIRVALNRNATPRINRGVPAALHLRWHMYVFFRDLSRASLSRPAKRLPNQTIGWGIRWRLPKGPV